MDRQADRQTCKLIPVYPGKHLFCRGIIINRGYLFFLVKDRNLFHRVDTMGNIFTSGAEDSPKKTNISYFKPFWAELYQNPVQFFSIIPCGVSLLHSNALQY